MERLTEKFVCNLPDEVLEKLGITDVPKENYEIKEVFGGATCKEVCEEHECSNCPINKVINKLADYEDAEEQGLLLRLPCKVGDELWAIRNYKGTVYAQKGFVNEMFLTKEMKLIIAVKNIARGEFGKTVFLTKEEAELALANMKDERNGR